MNFREIKQYTYDELLKKIDQEKVWSNIVGHCRLNEFILNPLRPDSHAGSCKLQSLSGKILLIDWADSDNSGYDCINAYRKLHPNKGWSEVCRDLLRMTTFINGLNYTIIPGLSESKPSSVFFPITRKWNKYDKAFWGKRGVTRFQLDREETKVYPLKGYIQIKDGKQEEFYFDELGYCYDHGERYKFYYPFRKKWKFFGNANSNDAWFLRRNSNTLIVAKSHKDLLVLENVCNYDITHVQGESRSSIPPSIEPFLFNYQKVILFFDNDEPGIKGANRLSNLISNSSIFYIDKSLDVKDTDEFIIKYGKDFVTNYFLKTDFKL